MKKKHRDFRPISRLLVSVEFKTTDAVTPKRNASVNLHMNGVRVNKLVWSKYVDNSKRRLRLYISANGHAEENRAEFICTRW